MNLKQALEAGKLDQFIAKHKNDIGDQADLERVIHSMAGTSKEAPQSSPQDDCDD